MEQRRVELLASALRNFTFSPFLTIAYTPRPVFWPHFGHMELPILTKGLGVF